MDDGLRHGAHSRASAASSDVSELTERPISDASTRPLSRDFEHIKTLVSRAYNNGSRKPDGGITAQVFRRKGPANSDSIYRDRIYQELDLLKRRIRGDQEEEARRAGQDAPELDMNLTLPDAVDSRPGEYLGLAEELQMTRIHNDVRLESGASRNGSLSGEKDLLSATLQQSRNELQIARSEKEAAERALRDAEVKTRVLDSQLKDIRTHLDMARVELETVRTERRDAQAKYEWAMAEKNELATKFDSASGGMQDLKKQLATLEHDRRQTTTAANEAQQRVSELERRVGDAETAAYQGSRAHEARQREHAAKIEEFEIKLAEATRKADLHERNWQQAVEEREAVKQQMEETSLEKSQHKARLDALLLEKDNISRGLNDAETWRNSHLRQLDLLRSENDHNLNMLRKEMVESKNRSKTRLADVAAQLAAKSKDAQAARQQLAQQEDALATAERRYKELEVLVQLKDSEVDRMREDSKHDSLTIQSSTHALHKQHAEQVAKLKQESEDRIQQLKDSYTQKRERMLAGHRAAIDQTSKDLQERHEATLEELSSRHAAELEAAYSKAKLDLAAAEDRHLKLLSEAQSMHATEIIRLKNEHKSATTVLKADLNRSRKTCQDLEEYAALEIARLQTQHEEAVREVEQDWALRLEDAVSQHQSVLHQTREDHQKQLQDRDAAVDERLASVSAEGDDQAARIKDVYEAELASARSESEAIRSQLSDLHRAHDEELVRMQQKQLEILEQLQSNQNDEAESLRQNHEREYSRLQESHRSLLAERDLEAGKLQDTFIERIAELEEKHQTAIHRMGVQHQKELESLHAENRSLLAQSAEATSVHSGPSAETLQQHETALANANAAHEAASRELQAKVSELEQALEAAHSATQDRLEGTLKQEDASLVEIRTQHESTTQELMRKIQKLEQALVDSEQHLHVVQAEKTSREVDGGEGDRSAEFEKLRMEHAERLTAASTALQAELDAAVAAAREESSEALEAQAAAHQKQFNLLQESSDDELHVLQDRIREINDKMQDLMTTRESMHAEMADLRVRLDVELVAHAEAERALAMMRKQRAEEEQRHRESKELLLQKQIQELRKEKENLTQQHRHSISSLLELKPRSPRFDSTKTAPIITEEHSDDAVVQQMQIRLLQQELKSAQSIVQKHEQEQHEIGRQNEFLVKEVEVLMARLNSRTNSPIDRKSATPLLPDETAAETMNASPLARQTTPATPATALADMPEPKTDAASGRDMKARQRSTTPSSRSRRSRSHLGTPTHSEVLFNQKTQHYIGDLQQAKDHLANKYQSQVEGLLAQKKRRDRETAAKAASDFRREQAKLVDQFGGDQNGDLSRAEEHLVTELNRRVVKKKAQIAHKYASDFSKVTAAYDQHLSELLDGWQGRSEDFSAINNRFAAEQDRSEYIISPLPDERSVTNHSSRSPDARRPQSQVLEMGAQWDDQEDVQWPLPGASPAPGQAEPYVHASGQFGEPTSAVSDSRGSIRNGYPSQPRSYAATSRGPRAMSSRGEIDDGPRPAAATRYNHYAQDSYGFEAVEIQPRTSHRSLSQVAATRESHPYRSSPGARSSRESNQYSGHGSFSHVSRSVSRAPEVRQPTTIISTPRGRRAPAFEVAPSIRTSEPRTAANVHSAYARKNSAQPGLTSIPPSQRMAERRSKRALTHSSASLFATQTAA